METTEIQSQNKQLSTRLLVTITATLILTNGCVEFGRKSKSSTPVVITTGKDMVDIDGNIYHSVTIGKQTWTTENLKVTKLNDGQEIPYISDTLKWAVTDSPAMCEYDNSYDAGNRYGFLYNGYAIESGKICPKGWHVPSDMEWSTLIDTLNAHGSAGKGLKSRGGWHINLGNNASGFNALPGGIRFDNGHFVNSGFDCFIWSSSIDAKSSGRGIRMKYDDNELRRSSFSRKDGLYVRCVKDSIE